MPSVYGFYGLSRGLRSSAPLGLAVGAIILGAVLWLGFGQKKREWDAKKAAVAPCLAAGRTVGVCHDRLDERSAECFLLTYTPKTRYRVESFDQNGFNECATGDATPKDWLYQRAAAQREAKGNDQDQRRELLKP